MEYKYPAYMDAVWLKEQRNRPILMRWFRQQHPITDKEQMNWYINLDTSKNKPFVIWDGDERIGYVGLNPVDLRHSKGEFGIFISPEYQGKGYAQKAMEFILRYGFLELNLHKIYSDVFDIPGNAWPLYEKLGFVKEGLLKEEYFKDNMWIDSIIFSMTINRYKELYPCKSPSLLETSTP